MTDSQIRCFLDLCRTNSFTTTADNLYLTQQAVSRRIRSLESSLGAKLFTRRKKEVALTEAGHYYYSVFSNVREQYEQFLSETSLYYDILGSSLRIGCAEWIDRFGLLADAINSLRDKYPNIQITSEHMPNRALFDALSNGNLDLCVFPSEQTPNHRELASEHIAAEDIRLFGPKEIIESLPPEKSAQCWDLPLLFTSSWEYDYLEQILLGTKLGARAQRKLGILPTQAKIVPDAVSRFAELQYNNVAVIGGYNFGPYTRIDRLGSVSLHVDAFIDCVWKITSENPLIPAFISYMKEYFSQPPAPAESIS